MLHLIHDVPGRLRFEAPTIRRNLRAAAAVRRRARALHGVVAVTASPLTGSIIVRYDGTEITRARIVAGLDATERPAIGSAATPARSGGRVVLTSRGQAMAERIADALAEKLVEHALKAAVAALV